MFTPDKNISDSSNDNQEEQIKILKETIKSQKEIRIFIDDTNNYGHQASSIHIIYSLIFDFGYRNPITVLYKQFPKPHEGNKKNNREKIDQLLARPNLKKSESNGNKYILEVHGQEVIISLIEISITGIEELPEKIPKEIIKNEIFMGLTGGDDNGETINFSKIMNTKYFLRLQPYKWGVKNNNSPLQIIQSNKTIDISRDIEDLAYYYQSVESITEESWEFYSSQENMFSRIQAIKSLINVLDKHKGKIDLLPIQGVRELKSSSPQYNGDTSCLLFTVLIAVLKAQKERQKPAIIINFGEISSKLIGDLKSALSVQYWRENWRENWIESTIESILKDEKQHFLISDNWSKGQDKIIIEYTEGKIPPPTEGKIPSPNENCFSAPHDLSWENLGEKVKEDKFKDTLIKLFGKKYKKNISKNIHFKIEDIGKFKIANVSMEKQTFVYVFQVDDYTDSINLYIIEGKKFPYSFLEVMIKVIEGCNIDDKKINFINIADSSNKKLPNDYFMQLLNSSQPRVVFLQLGSVPNELFNYLFFKSTLPSIFEGQNTASLALSVGKPFIHLVSQKHRQAYSDLDSNQNSNTISNTIKYCQKLPTQILESFGLRFNKESKNESESDASFPIGIFNEQQSDFEDAITAMVKFIKDEDNHFSKYFEEAKKDYASEKKNILLNSLLKVLELKSNSSS